MCFGWPSPFAADVKRVVVLGATGAQGGGVVRGLSGLSGYEVRAVSRTPDSAKAQALSLLPGVTVVAASMDDAQSLEAAFAGAYGVFCVTNFWEHFSVATEVAQCARVAAAAKAAGVRHVVWSTLEGLDALPASESLPGIVNGGETYKVPHFEGKALSDAAFRNAGVPTTFMRTSFYWDNMIGLGMGPKKDADSDGNYKLSLPQKPTDVLPGIAAQDIGLCAAGIFQDPNFIGRTVGIVGEHLTCVQMAAQLSKAWGVDVQFQQADGNRSQP
ncbi:hypothetical protein M885DRAFT_612092 [Pelagophyceae sp. CCMP2097]|nr:hypothetical protein M885DRAFT_612092 [Pelagophyceae sp. CCMP2097]